MPLERDGNRKKKTPVVCHGQRNELNGLVRRAIFASLSGRRGGWWVEGGGAGGKRGNGGGASGEPDAAASSSLMTSTPPTEGRPSRWPIEIQTKRGHKSTRQKKNEKTTKKIRNRRNTKPSPFLAPTALEFKRERIFIATSISAMKSHQYLINLIFTISTETILMIGVDKYSYLKHSIKIITSCSQIKIIFKASEDIVLRFLITK